MKKTVLGGNKEFFQYLLYGLIAVGVTLIFICAFAFILLKTNLNREYVPLISTLCVAAGCFVSSFAAGKKIKGGGYKIGLIIGTVAFALITLLSFILGGGSVSLNTLFHFLIVTVASLIGGISGVNRAQNKKII